MSASATSAAFAITLILAAVASSASIAQANARPAEQAALEAVQSARAKEDFAGAVRALGETHAGKVWSAALTAEQMSIEKALGIPAGTSWRLDAAVRKASYAEFLSTAEHLSFHYEGEDISEQCHRQPDAMVIARLRIVLSDLPGLGLNGNRSSRTWWANERFTAHLGNDPKRLADRELLRHWIELATGLLPSLRGEDVHIALEELRRYHDRIVELPGWRDKLHSVAGELKVRGEAERETIHYVGGPLHGVFHRAGFPASQRPCFLASVSSGARDFSNEDIRVTNEGWLYSFWARRFFSGTFLPAARLLFDAL